MAQNLFKKYVSIALAFLVLFITVLSILAIWEIVDIDQFMQKTMVSLIVIFISSAVLLFIFSILYPVSFNKNSKNQNDTPVNQ